MATIVLQNQDQLNLTPFILSKVKKLGVGFLMLLAGCATPMTREHIANMPDAELCRVTGVYIKLNIKAEPLTEEVLHRGLLTQDQFEDVRLKQIKIGTPICGMYAVFGIPTIEHRTVTSGGTHIQHVYRSGGSASASYFYSDNGKIVSWQD